MSSMQYVGLDVHKKMIAYCVKEQDGRIVEEGEVGATLRALEAWAAERKAPWIGAMEATLFSGWIYDFLAPHADGLKVAHPAMLKAISASKKKNDKVDARKIADLLRCDLLPECYMASESIRELRRVLRYRHLMVYQAVRMKNKTAGLLMEVGAEYSRSRIHRKGYFRQWLETVQDVPESVMELVKLSHASAEMFDAVQRKLLAALKNHSQLKERVERLMTIPGVGQVTALSWALEIGDPERVGSVGRAVSYCGLCSRQDHSAGKEKRGPISKQRNKHLQTVLIEAAKLAPRFNAHLAAVHERELRKGNRNRATLAVARKLVAYLLAVDRSGKAFEEPEIKARAA